MGILHMEIILECILPRLPAKSLIRFKCVSKSFLAEISSSKFIKQHHHNAISSNSNRLLILPIPCQGVYVYDLNSPQSPPSLFCPYPDLSVYAPLKFIVATCKGSLLIACGLVHLSNLVLLNPSTRTYREIRYEQITCMSALYAMCHCLDEFNDEYKVVQFANFDGIIEGHVPEVMVYNTTTNTWKEIESKAMVNSFISGYGNTPVLVQNHLVHLLFFTRGHGLHQDHIKRIGCFDMKAEQWANDVPLPDVLWDENGFNFSYRSPYELGALDDQLCFTGFNVIKSSFDLWVMKEYGEKESWVNLMSLRVSRDLDDQQLLEASYKALAQRTGSPHELLYMKGRNNCKLYRYNLKDKDDTEAEFSTPLKWDYLACICKGSLLDFPGGQPIRVSLEEEDNDDDDNFIVNL